MTNLYIISSFCCNMSLHLIPKWLRDPLCHIKTKYSCFKLGCSKISWIKNIKVKKLKLHVTHNIYVREKINWVGLLIIYLF